LLHSKFILRYPDIGPGLGGKFGYRGVESPPTSWLERLCRLPCGKPPAFRRGGKPLSASFLAMMCTNGYGVAPCQSCGALFYFFITVRLLPRRTGLMEEETRTAKAAVHAAEPIWLDESVILGASGGQKHPQNHPKTRARRVKTAFFVSRRFCNSRGRASSSRGDARKRPTLGVGTTRLRLGARIASLCVFRPPIIGSLGHGLLESMKTNDPPHRRLAQWPPFEESGKWPAAGPDW
jgi:hypothetical protein